MADGDGGASAWSPTDLGRRTLERRREDLAAIEARTGARLQTGSALDAVLARFGARVRAATGRVAIDDIEKRLEEVAAEIEAPGDQHTEEEAR